MAAIWSCAKKTDEATVDLETPSFSTAVSFSARTASTFTATWAATDNVTVASNLSYKVVSSSSNNITTVADALANGTIVQDWTVNSLTANFSALTDSTNYYVSVLVRDTDGNTGISAGATTTLCSGKAMFLATVPNGNLGGASGADGICAAQKPAGFTSATFKAMLTDSGVRQACNVSDCTAVATGRTGWVFAVSQKYCTSDYEKNIG